MRAARRQGVLGVVHCGTGSSPRVRVLMPLLFNIFAAVLNVAYTSFKEDKDIMDSLVHLRKKKGAGGSNCPRACPDDVALEYALH